MTKISSKPKIEINMGINLKRYNTKFARQLIEHRAAMNENRLATMKLLDGLRKHLAERLEIDQENESGNPLIAELDRIMLAIDQQEDAAAAALDNIINDHGILRRRLETALLHASYYESLYELQRLIESSADFDKIVGRLISIVSKMLNAQFGMIEFYDSNGQPVYTKQLDTNGNGGNLEKIKGKLMQTVEDGGKPLVLNNLIIRGNGNNGKPGSLICIPLKFGSGTKGILLFGAYRKYLGFDKIELLEYISRRFAHAAENLLINKQSSEQSRKAIDELRRKYDFSFIIGESSELRRVLSTVALIADTDSTVLIEGESGTGKEIIAQAIHYNSRRRNGQFIAINCSAIPETLLESELFGYEKGAFTGATSRKPGKFELADGGTILLDEIGELSMTLQVKLLRFLQSHEFEPLGSNKLLKSDVRIITATKRDLMRMVHEGRFRDDLFYRINVINIRMPLLRERTGDIPLLVKHFIEKYKEKNNRGIIGITDEALASLEEYDFPGNVRELENIIERAVVMCQGTMLGIEDLPERIREQAGLADGIIPRSQNQLRLIKKKIIDESFGPIEKSFVQRALKRSRGNISEAARLAQMHRRQFQRILNRHRITDQT